MSATNMERRRLDAIDVARGGAAIVVLLEHALHACFPAYKAYSEAHFQLGQAAVLLFFMISGFVIPMSLEEGRSVANFWTRRFFRLFPVYWLSLAAAYLCFPLGLPSPSAVQPGETSTWLANVFLIQEKVRVTSVLGVYWTLDYEWTLYLAFSILAAFGVLGRIGAWTFAALLAFRALSLSSWSRGAPGVLTYHQAILLAVVFGFLTYRYWACRFTRRAFYSLAVAVLAVFAVRWSINRVVFASTQPATDLLRWTLTLGLACATFALLFEARQNRLPRIWCWLGRRSFPIYLLHSHAFSLIWDWPGWAYLPAGVALTLLFADIAHRLVERPAINFGRWLERRKIKTTVEPPIELKRAA